MPEPRLFDDDFTLDSDVADDLATNGETMFQSQRHLVIGLAIAAAILAVWLMFGSSATTRGSLTLTGAEAGQLRPGAAVVLDGKQVGEVEQVAIHNGLPTARLQVDPDVLQEVPATSRLQVGSLNRILPGNIGVKIVTAEHDEAIPGSGWESIHERLADQSIVPTRTPLGFYIVLFVVVAVAVLLLGLVIKVLKSTAFWAAVFIALIVVVLHAWQTGKLDETARWGHEQIEASQATGAQNR